MLTISLLLVLVALAIVLGAAVNKAPLWPAVLILALVHLLNSLPIQ
jgi:hypothetical protein